jgi:ATP-binding cassette subfamily B (MDR/TAP) protein 1
LLSILFGNLTKDFVQFATVLALAKQGDQEAAARIPEVADSFRRVAAKDASYLVYIGKYSDHHERPHLTLVLNIGIGIFACTYAYMYIWVVTGELNAKRVREKYLEATLRQEVAYFDNVGSGEVATRIQTDTRTVISHLFMSDVLIKDR